MEYLFVRYAHIVSKDDDQINRLNISMVMICELELLMNATKQVMPKIGIK